MLKSLAAASLLVAAMPAGAETYVVPVVTARIKPVTYSTTTGFKNDSGADVQCSARYVRSDGRVLTTSYTIEAAAHLVEPDTLLEAAAAGTMLLDCTGELTIASRIQSSNDDGLTFDAGSVFSAGKDRNAITPAKARTMKVDGDLLVMEPNGAPATFTLRLTDQSGAVVGEKRYELRAHEHQQISMARIVEQLGPTPVQIEVASGRVVVVRQVRDAKLARLAPEVTLEQRVQAAKRHAATAAEEVKPSITEQMLLCPFKAAPFRDPATGLCFMRDRWYDPSTGTFLTPDPAGYADSSNLYAYCKNDPVNCTDPTGRSATVGGGLLGTIGGSGYTIYRSVRYGDPFTWRYIAQGALSGAAIGFGIDTLGAGSGLSASVLGGTAIGAGGGAAFSSIQSGGDWGAYGRGTLKGGALGGVGGATGYGISAAGLSGGWAFVGSVTADTYAGVGIDYLFGDATTLSRTVTHNAVGSLAGNTVGYGAKWPPTRSASRLPFTASGDLPDLPTLSPAELQLITDNLRRQGVAVTVGGEAAAEELASYQARGLFFPTPGQPGRFVIGHGAPRVVVYEELVHFLQHRRAEFSVLDNSSYGRALVEIDAYRSLEALGQRRGWTGAELHFLAAQRAFYEENLWKLGRR